MVSEPCTLSARGCCTWRSLASTPSMSPVLKEEDRWAIEGLEHVWRCFEQHFLLEVKCNAPTRMISSHCGDGWTALSEMMRTIKNSTVPIWVYQKSRGFRNGYGECSWRLVASGRYCLTWIGGSVYSHLQITYLNSSPRMIRMDADFTHLHVFLSPILRMIRRNPAAFSGVYYKFMIIDSHITSRLVFPKLWPANSQISQWQSLDIRPSRPPSPVKRSVSFSEPPSPEEGREFSWAMGDPPGISEGRRGWDPFWRDWTAAIIILENVSWNDWWRYTLGSKVMRYFEDFEVIIRR